MRMGDKLAAREASSRVSSGKCHRINQRYLAEVFDSRTAHMIEAVHDRAATWADFARLFWIIGVARTSKHAAMAAHVEDQEIIEPNLLSPPPLAATKRSGAPRSALKRHEGSANSFSGSEAVFVSDAPKKRPP